MTQPKGGSRASPKRRKAEPPRMRLTERDKAILYTLLDHRMVDMAMLVRLHFYHGSTQSAGGGWSSAKRRLRLLWDHHFVNRHFLPTLEVGHNPYVFTLGANGAAVLRKAGADPEKIERCLKYSPRFKAMFAMHALSLARFRCCFQLLSDYRWLEELDEATLKSRQLAALQQAQDKQLAAEEVVRWVPYYQDEQSQRIVHAYPDFYFVLRVGQQKYPVFLEYDRATTTLKRFARKVRAYQNFRNSAWFRKQYGFADFWVWTVTTSAARMNNLKAATEAEVGQELNEIALEKTRRVLQTHLEREPTPAEIEKKLDDDTSFRDCHFWFTLEQHIDLAQPEILVNNRIWYIAVGNMVTPLQGVVPVEIPLAQEGHQAVKKQSQLPKEVQTVYQGEKLPADR